MASTGKISERLWLADVDLDKTCSNAEDDRIRSARPPLSWVIEDPLQISRDMNNRVIDNKCLHRRSASKSVAYSTPAMACDTEISLDENAKPLPGQ